MAASEYPAALSRLIAPCAGIFLVVLAAAGFLHLGADFPNHSRWMDDAESPPRPAPLPNPTEIFTFGRRSRFPASFGRGFRKERQTAPTHRIDTGSVTSGSKTAAAASH